MSQTRSRKTARFSFVLPQFKYILPLPLPAYNRDRLIFEGSVFYKFVLNEKQNNKFISIPLAQKDFIEKYKISYGVVQKNAKLYPEIETLIKQKILDNNTGESFVLFK